MSARALQIYVKLIKRFLDREISVAEFERTYLDTFKQDTTRRSNDEFMILDELFAAVDAFCADPKLCDERDIDEDQLRHQCQLALQALQTMGKTDV